MAEIIKFKKNEIIFKEGDVGSTMYDIIFGSVDGDRRYQRSAPSRTAAVSQLSTIYHSMSGSWVQP